MTGAAAGPGPAATDPFDQAPAAVRFDWGPTGATHLVQGGCCVVVDVLTFTTAVSVAVERGMAVWPAGLGPAVPAPGVPVATRRSAVDAAHPWSLSPADLRRAPVVPALVLPSPNGSAIAAALGGVVVAGCLRNAAAVGRWLLAAGYGTAARPVVVIAAGERWPDGTLRPALEDLLGAGAIVDALAAGGAASLSPEAAAARAAHGATGDFESALRACASGRELVARGYGGDVAIAAEVDQSAVVPVREGGAFAPAR